MHIFYILFLLATQVQPSWLCLAIRKIIVRAPRTHDIGLIFDISVVNMEGGKKEMLEFRINPDGCCVVNITENETMIGAGKIFGGNFGFIDCGGSMTVSLIWPTVSLYNRVGYCPIIITSTSGDNKQQHLKETLYFDTRYTTLDPEGCNLRKQKDYVDCNNWDKDYFKNCEPVDCEERYFGQRSFYNSKSGHCEETARCTDPEEIYDIFANECIDIRHYCDEEDLQKIRQGKYEEEIMQLKCAQEKLPYMVVNPFADEKHNVKREHDGSNMYENNEGKKDFTREADNELTDENATAPYWLKGLADGLLIVGVIISLQVIATVAIYVLICFIIFLIVTWTSRRNSNTNLQLQYSLKTPITPELPSVCTTSSLLSQC